MIPNSLFITYRTCSCYNCLMKLEFEFVPSAFNEQQGRHYRSNQVTGENMIEYKDMTD